MRQKLCVTLAVAVMALSGARETRKHFNELRSLAGEWSGVWTTMLVYANAYAEGMESRPAPQTLIASNSDCRGEAAAATRHRRTRARIGRQTPRTPRDGAAATELRSELGEVAHALAPPPESTPPPAATREVSPPRLRVAANAGEITSALASAFHSDFDADSLRAFAESKGIELPRAALLEVLLKHERAGVVRKAARIERGGTRKHNRNRLVFRSSALPRVNAEVLRADEAVSETQPDAESGPVGVEETEVVFAVPQSSSSLLNCEAQPRR